MNQSGSFSMPEAEKQTERDDTDESHDHGKGPMFPLLMTEKENKAKEKR